MKIKKELSKEYWKALKVSLVLQIASTLLSGLCMDCGQMAQWGEVSLIAWWGGFLVAVFRRPMAPTKVDLFLIRWSFPVVCFLVTPFLMMLIWKLRGVDF